MMMGVKYETMKEVSNSNFLIKISQLKIEISFPIKSRRNEKEMILMTMKNEKYFEIKYLFIRTFVQYPLKDLKI